MSVAVSHWVLLSVAFVAAALPACANRLTFEVWPNPDPTSATFCSVALSGGQLSLVQSKGAGPPTPEPLRWRASDAEDEAMIAVLQAFVTGGLASVDPYVSRLPPAPFVTVTWMTTLDDHMETGLYLQPGLSLPPVLADMATALGLAQTCGLTARVAE